MTRAGVLAIGGLVLLGGFFNRGPQVCPLPFSGPALGTTVRALIPSALPAAPAPGPKVDPRASHGPETPPSRLTRPATPDHTSGR